MNEELQRQILEALRDLRSGAPGAFQTLVEQRSTYALVCAMSGIALAAISFALAAIAWRAASRAEARGSDDDASAIGFGCLLMAALGLVSLIVTVSWLPTWAAPLGGLLGHL